MQEALAKGEGLCRIGCRRPGCEVWQWHIVAFVNHASAICRYRDVEPDRRVASLQSFLDEARRGVERGPPRLALLPCGSEGGVRARSSVPHDVVGDTRCPRPRLRLPQP